MVLSYRHDHIGEGLRERLPNFVQIGMINCNWDSGESRRPNDEDQMGLLPAVRTFVESLASRTHGVIVVAFGTLVKRSKVPPLPFGIEFFTQGTEWIAFEFGGLFLAVTQ